MCLADTQRFRSRVVRHEYLLLLRDQISFLSDLLRVCCGFWMFLLLLFLLQQLVIVVVIEVALKTVIVLA